MFLYFVIRLQFENNPLWLKFAWCE